MTPPVVKCRSCGAPIIWAITERGKRIPLDAEPNNAKGNMILVPWGKSSLQTGGAPEVTSWEARVVAPLLDANQTRYMPHHATCPDAKRWRRA